MSEVLKLFVYRVLSHLWIMLPVNWLCFCINEAYSSPGFVCQPFKVHNLLCVFACDGWGLSQFQNYNLLFIIIVNEVSDHSRVLLFYYIIILLLSLCIRQIFYFGLCLKRLTSMTNIRQLITGRSDTLNDSDYICLYIKFPICHYTYAL